jgi:hypothetical protein
MTKDKTSRFRKHKDKLLVAVLVAVGVFWAWRLWPRPDVDLKAVATEVANAIEVGDTRTMMRYASPDEVEKLGLTEEKLRAYWEALEISKVKGLSGQDGNIASFGNSSVELTRLYTIPGRDRPATVTIAAHMAPGGKAAVPIIVPILTLSSTLRAKNRPEASESEWGWIAMGETIQRLEPRFHQIGLPGVYTQSKVVSWSDLQKFAVRVSTPKKKPVTTPGVQ